MAPKGKGKKKKGSYKKKKKSIYGTSSTFIPKELAMEQYGQVSTKTFYFKTAGTINSIAGGITQRGWTTQDPGATPADPFQFPSVGDSLTVAKCYTEYKVLAIRVRVFAANVGAEGGQLPAPGGTPNFIAGFNRGNTVMYLDQDIQDGELPPINIINAMTFGSCRMIPSRCDQYTKILYRPKGQPLWGCCDNNVPVPNRIPDPWRAGVFLLGNNARPTPGVSPLWFYTATYKIIFRGRAKSPP